MKNRIFIIDGSSYLYRAFHAMPPLSTSSGKPTGAVKGVTNMLMNLKKDSEGSSIIVVFDAKGKTFRNDIYSDYKANRPPMPDELREQLEPVKSICKAIGFPLIEISGVEADDVIATISRMAKEAKYKCVISSLDKDLMQLVEDPHTTMMDTMKHKIFNEEGVFEKFGVKPNQIRDMLALVGDSSDNIPGIPKVGQKTAAKWLKEYGNLEGIKKNADSISGVVGENLRNNLDDLDLFKGLWELRDICESVDSILNISSSGDTTWELVPTLDNDSLLIFFPDSGAYFTYGDWQGNCDNEEASCFFTQTFDLDLNSSGQFSYYFFSIKGMNPVSAFSNYFYFIRLYWPYKMPNNII